VITAVLTTAVVCFMLYGRVPSVALAVLAFTLGAALAYLGRHSHTRFLTIDVIAQMSRLANVNASLKFFSVLALTAICVSAKSAVPGVFLIAAMLVFTVFAGGLPLGEYVRLLALPVSFLMISGLVLLFEVADQRAGILSYNIFGLWFCVSKESQARAALVTARALGAISCLFLLSLTTPMPDIIGVLRRVRCPDLIIDLMYLIYRYIFILLSLHHEMRNAAKSRLGFRDYRSSLRTAGKIYSNLLARSYQFAGKNFDAMESRCYDTGIRFLERQNRITFAQASVSAILLLISLSISLLPL